MLEPRETETRTLHALSEYGVMQVSHYESIEFKTFGFEISGVASPRKPRFHIPDCFHGLATFIELRHRVRRPNGQANRGVSLHIYSFDPRDQWIQPLPELPVQQGGRPKSISVHGCCPREWTNTKSFLANCPKRGMRTRPKGFGPFLRS